MKNLANCSPREFFAQAVKVREPLMAWMDEIGFREIKKRRPEGYDDMKPEEKVDAMAAQAAENMAEILSSAMQIAPDKTLEVMALSCFTEPSEVETHTMPEYLRCIREMLESREVRDFFSLYLRQTGESSSKA